MDSSSLPDPGEADTLSLPRTMEIDSAPSALPPGGWDAGDDDNDSLDRKTTLQLSPGAIDLAMGGPAVPAVGASNQTHGSVDNI